MNPRSANVYLKVFSLCERCSWSGKMGCTNLDGFFEFKTGEYCEGFSPKRKRKETRKVARLGS